MDKHKSITWVTTPNKKILSEEEIKKRAQEVFKKENIKKSPTIFWGQTTQPYSRSINKKLLSKATQRFRPTAATTAREVGEAIRLRRKDLGQTQKELAEISGTRERFISEVERGKETAEIGKVLDLLDALGLESRIVVRS